MPIASFNWVYEASMKASSIIGEMNMPITFSFTVIIIEKFCMDGLAE